jgi:predicted oxidoreductase
MAGYRRSLFLLLKFFQNHTIFEEKTNHNGAEGALEPTVRGYRKRRFFLWEPPYFPKIMNRVYTIVVIRSLTGGLDVNEKIQVLNTDRQVIPGLYAVGQDSSGVLYNDTEAYVGYGAADQGWAVTAGRWAGENAAREAAGIH